MGMVAMSDDQDGDDVDGEGWRGLSDGYARQHEREQEADEGEDVEDGGTESEMTATTDTTETRETGDTAVVSDDSGDVGSTGGSGADSDSDIDIDIPEEWDEIPVRERENVNLYLPPSVAQQLRETFMELNMEMMKTHGRELKKNSEFYPLVLSVGMECEEVRRKLGLGLDDE